MEMAISNLQDTVFSSLRISKDQLLSEMAILLAKQQLSEFSMEIEYFEKKYGKNFSQFDCEFRTQEASYEKENDWMSWKFAVESRSYIQIQNVSTGYSSINSSFVTNAAL